jgi:uncharacterized membrane protein
MSLYLILKWLHVLLAIIAVGTNITYSIWLARARKNPEHLAFVLRGVKILDDRVANPAYGLLLVIGIIMTFVGGIPMSTPWILSALVLYVMVFGMGLFLYTPTLRRQVELAEAGEGQSAESQALAQRGTVLGIVLAVLVVAIVFLMVVKPSLWAA